MPILNLLEGESWKTPLTMADSIPYERKASWVGVKVKNNADVAIEGRFLRLTVSNSINNVTCEDITSLQFLDTATEIQLAKGFQHLESLCTQVGKTTVYNIPITSLAPETTYEYPAKIVFGNVAPATYTFNAQMQLA
jgi:hypothetical protein